MPLLGKIVVIKRNGEDGTEFPLTASCLFGRKLNCDIRIQLPQVSKEHCKIELNENKELILTNLSSVNPTCVNGEALQQSERLKHGDLITIIDRSFRFEYPPPKTPKKKRLSTSGKDKTPQLEKSTPVPVEKRKSEHSFDTCLKDGSNLPQSVEQTVETTADEKPKKDSLSPFGELYQMVKQDLVAKSPWKSGIPKTPLARPQADQVKFTADIESCPTLVTTPSGKRRRSSKGNFEDKTEVDASQSLMNLEDYPAGMESVESSNVEKSGTPVSQKKRTPSKTPEKFSAGEVVQQILVEPQPEEKTSKSPKKRSGEPQTPVPEVKNTVAKVSPRTSPRSNAGKRFQVQDVLNDIKTATMTENKDKSVLKAKRKRVSFGGQLSPELFDKRMPPNSPLRRGATPRRSLGLSQKHHPLLRRASTIGLMALSLEETSESTKPQSSPTKKASPKRASATKAPLPATRSPAKTPSPKSQKSPSGASKASTPSSTPATPKTPASSRRASTSNSEAVGDGSVVNTPRVQGRFSISHISTPSPIQDEVNAEMADVDDTPLVSKTPKIPLRRKSMKSARKTPKSAIKSALDVMRSRRSGASRANLKVLNSWADIVKFGQSKPQTEVTMKKQTTKSSMVKRTAVPKPKTPAQKLKDAVSTGHAASPATIVVGKAHLRSNQSVGSAPKVVPNIALFTKDMKMDEDLTGVADIFKTPANKKSKNVVPVNKACPETPLDEMSVMKTPEESGEMIVSPLSVVSTAKHERYNNEAVTRLLLHNQGDSLLDQDCLSQLADMQEPTEMSKSDQTEEEEEVPKTPVTTPKQATAASLCLTGVKRLMKTPKQKAEPIEDLRGKLLKTPNTPKHPQEENLQGVKELFTTPKHRGVPVEDVVDVKRVKQTPKEQKNNPVLCAAGLKRLMKTPKEKSEHQEDLTGLKHLLKTPKHKGQPVEGEMGVKRLMQTPKEKVEHLEDFTGVKQLMKTPKQKGEAVKNKFGISKLMKTPRQKREAAEEDFTGLKELIQEPESSSTTQNDMTKTVETQEPVPAVENDSAFMPPKGVEKECDKENICPVEPMETEVVKSMDLQCSAEAIDLHLKTESVNPQTELCELTEEELAPPQVTDVCAFEIIEKTKEQPEETVCISDSSSITAEQGKEEVIKSPVVSRPQRNARGGAAQKPKAPAVLSLIEECALPPSSPGRGRRAKKLTEVPDVAASPLRKSIRGRVPKPCSEGEEAKDTEAMKTEEVSDCPSPVTKTKRGRKAQNIEAEPVQDAPAVEILSSDAPAVEEESIQTSVPKGGRRRMNHKMESQPSEEHQQTTEIVCEENAVVTDDVSLPTSEVPITVIRAKRLRPGKKESSKTDPSPTLESNTTNAHVDVVAEKSLAPVAKSSRGRVSKKETVKAQTSDDDPKVDARLDGQDEPEAPVAKSGRGRRGKQQKPQMDEVENQAAVDKVETEVKSVRRGRSTKQSKEKVTVEAEKNDVGEVEQTEVPVVKSIRKRPAESETGADVPAKRGRRAVVEPTPPVAVVSGRGRKAVVKAQPEVTEDVASSEEQVKPVKQTRRTAKVSESKKNENLNTELNISESVAAENTAPEKVGRGARGRKEKVLTKDTSENLTDESTEEVAMTKTSKTVNWSPDLVTSNDIKELEPSADVKAQPKKSMKSSAKISTENDQSTDLPPRGRRGRGVRKEEEPSVEDSPEELQVKAKPVRRGKAAAKSESSDRKASTPLKRKRNEMLEVNDHLVDKEPLPKRRGRITSSTEVVTSEEKTTEAEPAPKTNAKRTARGQSKLTQETDPAPAQESGSGTSTRKGRSVKKAEAVNVSEAAPVRRTRRK